MDCFETVIYEKADGIGSISLNRPSKLNAYNVQMRDELYQVLEAVRDDPEVGVVVFRGEGRAFCAGADLTEFGAAPSLAVAREVRWERDVWGATLNLQKPTIAAIHGYCLGSGLELALLCDLRIACEDSQFGLPEVALGMIPAAGGTQTLPRYLGVSKALEMLLTRGMIGTAEALQMGLITQGVPPKSLDSEVLSTAKQLLSMDRTAVRAVKEAVWQGADLTLDQALDLEERLALRVMGQPEAT